MSIIRTKRASNFTVINNELINDPMLDWRDVGLLTYLLSKPDEWEVSVAHLQKVRKSGRDAIYTSLKSITAAGYATGKVNPKGGFNYEISDSPIYKPLTENPFAENPFAENPLTENPPQVITDTKQRLNITTTQNENFENSGTKLNALHREVFEWACADKYWVRCTNSEEDFLRAYCSPKGGMRKQFEQRHNVKQPTGGNNGTHRQPPKKLSPAERVRKAAGIGEFAVSAGGSEFDYLEYNRG